MERRIHDPGRRRSSAELHPSVPPRLASSKTGKDLRHPIRGNIWESALGPLVSGGAPGLQTVQVARRLPGAAAKRGRRASDLPPLGPASRNRLGPPSLQLIAFRGCRLRTGESPAQGDAFAGRGGSRRGAPRAARRLRLDPRLREQGHTGCPNPPTRRRGPTREHPRVGERPLLAHARTAAFTAVSKPPVHVATPIRPEAADGPEPAPRHRGRRTWGRLRRANSSAAPAASASFEAPASSFGSAAPSSSSPEQRTPALNPVAGAGTPASRFASRHRHMESRGATARIAAAEQPSSNLFLFRDGVARVPPRLRSHAAHAPLLPRTRLVCQCFAEIWASQAKF